MDQTLKKKNTKQPLILIGKSVVTWSKTFHTVNQIVNTTLREFELVIDITEHVSDIHISTHI